MILHQFEFLQALGLFVAFRAAFLACNDRHAALVNLGIFMEDGLWLGAISLELPVIAAPALRQRPFLALLVEGNRMVCRLVTLVAKPFHDSGVFQMIHRVNASLIRAIFLDARPWFRDRGDPAKSISE